MFNPYVCKYNRDADISRADVVVLSLLCNKKRVIEFGCGASTSIIAQVASELHCYDTNNDWLLRSQKECEDTTIQPTMHLIGHEELDVPKEFPDCDVLWIDGRTDLRTTFLKNAWVYTKETIIIHGSRIQEDIPSSQHLGYSLLSLIINDFWPWVEQVCFSYLNSNMLVVHKRAEPIYYENFYHTEFHHRKIIQIKEWQRKDKT